MHVKLLLLKEICFRVVLVPLTVLVSLVHSRISAQQQPSYNKGGPLITVPHMACSRLEQFCRAMVRQSHLFLLAKKGGGPCLQSSWENLSCLQRYLPTSLELLNMWSLRKTGEKRYKNFSLHSITG